jgi:hypothetical protein
VAEILTPQNFGEIGALESAENAEFFGTNFRNYAPVARNLLFDQPPPFLGGTPVKWSYKLVVFKLICFAISNLDLG